MWMVILSMFRLREIFSHFDLNGDIFTVRFMIGVMFSWFRLLLKTNGKLLTVATFYEGNEMLVTL